MLVGNVWEKKGRYETNGVSCSFFSLDEGGGRVFFAESGKGDGFTGEESSSDETWLKKEDKAKKKTPKFRRWQLVKNVLGYRLLSRLRS